MSDQPAAAPQSTGPIPPADAWTATRREIVTFLHENAKSLAEMYEATVLIVAGSPRGRLRLVAHTVREIGNRLPDYLDGQLDGESVKYKEHADELARLWRGAGVPIISTDLEPTSAGPDSDALQTIPAEVHRHISQIILDHEAGSERNRDKAARLFAAVSSENDAALDALRPAFDQWERCRRWFTGVVHDPGPRGTEEKREKQIQELAEQFGIFESVLSALVGSFYRNVSEIDAVLDEANRPRD